MPIETVRYTFGTIILVTHFLTIFVYLAYGLSKFDGIAQVAGGILTVTPLTALYLTAFIRHVVLEQSPEHASRTIPAPSFYVQLSIVCLFGLFLVFGSAYLFHTAVLRYEDIDIYTGLVETLFAAFMAIIFNNLFPETVLAPQTTPE